MNGFKVGTVLTLDDNKDYVISQAKMNEGSYYMLLIEMPDYKSFKFARLIDNEQLEEIDDVNLIDKLVVLFNKKD